MPAVNPETFVSAMAKAEGFNSFMPSRALKDAWREMAVTFNDCIEGKIKQDKWDDWAVWFKERGFLPDAQWNVLTLPTGTGKTQGVIHYCALLSQTENPTGVLIITKFTDEVERIAVQINALVGKDVAFTDHTKKKDKKRLSREEMDEAPILIITHAAYQIALKASVEDKDSPERWRGFTTWKKGQRGLVIIDECLDVVEPVEITLDTLRMIRGWIPYMWEGSEIAGSLDKLIEQFIKWESEYQQEYTSEKISPPHWSFLDIGAIALLGRELRKLPLAKMITGRKDKGAMFLRCTELFSDILYLLYHPSICQKKDGIIRLRSAYIGLPLHINNAVVLDATAKLNKIYNMAGVLPYFRDIPKNARSYKNVSLHLHYGAKNSKYALTEMEAEADENILFDPIKSLQPAIKKNEKVLIVTFKKVVKKLSALLKQEGYKNFSTAYWGNLNGKNNWQDYETIVLYGIPRLDDVTVENAELAFDLWHMETQNKFSLPDALINPDAELIEIAPQQWAYDDTGSQSIESYLEYGEYQQGFTASEVIQAINRIRCRRVVDGKGNCEPCKVYLLLKKGETDPLEKAILDAIRSEMPDIQEVAPVHLETKDNDKLTNKNVLVLNFFRELEKGEHQAKAIKEKVTALGAFSYRTVERIFEEIANAEATKFLPDSLVAQEMMRIARYAPERGKHAKSIYIRL